MNVHVKLFFVALVSLVARSTANLCIPAILQPVSGNILLGGPGFGSIGDTIDQDSLVPMYTSGLTPFDTYIASHTFTFRGFEWFSNLGTTAATLVYDLGEELKIDGMSYWNEDASVSMDVRVSVSSDGVSFAEATSFMPMDNPVNQNYFNEVISFSPVSARFVKLEMTNCVNPTFQTCSVGEVAFRQSCEGNGGAIGDPHILRWDNKWYDYMGACDLVLVEAPDFAPGQSLSVHIRTTIQYEYSYIEAAVLKIGDDMLEVGSWGQHWLNGVEGAVGLGIENPNLSGYPISYTQKNKKTHIFRIELTSGEEILIRTFKDMVSVVFDNADPQRFDGSVGMMGEFGTGRMLARDGETELDDPNLFAAEWQVRDDEPMLFEAVRAPQYPQLCMLPDSTSKSASVGKLPRKAAKEACAHWKENKEGCIKDVMATGDVDLATAGW